MSNPVVFFDIAIGGQPAGRIEMSLRADICPKTVENFRYGIVGVFLVSSLPMSQLSFSWMFSIELFALVKSPPHLRSWATRAHASTVSSLTSYYKVVISTAEVVNPSMVAGLLVSRNTFLSMAMES